MRPEAFETLETCKVSDMIESRAVPLIRPEISVTFEMFEIFDLIEELRPNFCLPQNSNIGAWIIGTVPDVDCIVAAGRERRGQSIVE